MSSISFSKTTRYLTGLALVLGLVSMSACTGSKGGAKGVLKLPAAADAKSLDPAMADDLYTNEAVSLIYEGLVEYEYLKRPHQLRPLIAEAMPTVSADGLVYTFKIKKGVKFTDSAHFEGGKGRDVTAQDFIYSFMRIADPKINSGGFWIFDGKIKGLNEWRDKNKDAANVDYASIPDGLKALDDSTLQITLVNPYPQLLFVLAMSYGAVVPREVVEKLGKDFGNNPVGTGPYILDRWMRGSKISYVRNPNYAHSTYPTEAEEGDDPALLADAGKKLPLMDRIELSIFTESQPLWLNFLSGQLDRAGIPKDNFESVIDTGTNNLKKEFVDKGMVLSIAPSPDVTYTAFNMLDPFIKKAGPKFRQAIALAGDTKDTLKVFYNNRGIPAHTPVPPGLAGYDENFINPYQRFDLEAAKKLLAEAGYPGGKGVPVLQYEIGQGAESRQMAEDFQRRMDKLGIKIQINVNQFSELLSKIDQKKAMMWGVAWGADYPDAENFLQLLYGPNAAPGPNGANYNNPEYNKLFEQMRYMQDSPERRQIIRRMMEIFATDMPWLPGIHRVTYGLSQKWLQNYKPGFMGGHIGKFLRVNDDLKGK